PTHREANQRETSLPSRRPAEVKVQPKATDKSAENFLEETTVNAPQSLLVPIEQTAEEITHPLRTRESESLRRDGLPQVRPADAPPVVRRTTPGSRRTQAQPSRRPVLAADSSLPANELSPNEPPIVHVTIGRIEVRATPAATPAPHRPIRSTPPNLTLDAYLKERQEGRR
ncbi:MAG: hypothetical protein ACREFG_06155, partial [Chthoniobacterales bacterium]